MVDKSHIIIPKIERHHQTGAIEFRSSWNIRLNGIRFRPKLKESFRFVVVDFDNPQKQKQRNSSVLTRACCCGSLKTDVKFTIMSAGLSIDGNVTDTPKLAERKRSSHKQQIKSRWTSLFFYVLCECPAKEQQKKMIFFRPKIYYTGYLYFKLSNRRHLCH